MQGTVIKLEKAGVILVYHTEKAVIKIHPSEKDTKWSAVRFHLFIHLKHLCNHPSYTKL